MQQVIISNMVIKCKKCNHTTRKDFDFMKKCIKNNDKGNVMCNKCGNNIKIMLINAVSNKYGFY